MDCMVVVRVGRALGSNVSPCLSQKEKLNYRLRTTPRRWMGARQGKIADVASYSSGLTAASFHHWHLSCPEVDLNVGSRESYRRLMSQWVSSPGSSSSVGSSHETQLVFLLFHCGHVGDG